MNGMDSPTTSGTEWAERAEAALIGNYRRQPIAFVAGQGATLTDSDGRDYIDLAAGIAVCTLGHGHAGLAEALAAQARRLIHVSNLYLVPEQIRLAEALRAFTGFDRFFFCNSGTEANEAAIKLLRAWGRPRGRSQIIVMQGGFHGRTLGALSATAQPEMQAPFQPLLDGFVDVPFDDLDSVAAAIGPQTAGILVEPIQAEGGGRFPSAGYLAGLRELCDRHGALLVFDEVQTGMGRTGRPLAAEVWDVHPDAVTLAKGLGGGVPIGALAVCEALADVLGPGTHGSTFGGNPLAMAAALTVVEALTDGRLMANVRARSAELLATLERWSEVGVRNPRGEGLLIAFDVDDAARVVAAAREAGVLVVAAKYNTVRLLPPLVLSEEECTEGLRRLHAALTAALQENA